MRILQPDYRVILHRTPNEFCWDAFTRIVYS